MKLYATIQSERAMKGQGGNEYLNIVVKNEFQEDILILTIHPARKDGRIHGYLAVLGVEIHSDTTQGLTTILPTTQLDAPKLRKRLIHDPRTCENSIPCYDCEITEKSAPPKRACSICGDPLYGEVQVHHHNEDCKKCGYTIIASQQHNCKSIKGKKEKSKECGNCGRPATQSIANINRCDRCATL